LGIYGQLSQLRLAVKRRTLMTPLDPIATALGTGLDYLARRFIPAPRHETEVVVEGGYRLVLPPGLPSARRLLTGTYEPEVTATVRALLAPGMRFVDVGANVGYYSLIGAQAVGAAGHVYAFEPERQVFKYLELNARRNAIPQLTLICKALADTTGSMPFISSALEGGFLSFSSASLAMTGSVDTVRLDQFFSDAGWPAIDLIKLDVEGAEGSVLAGMSELSTRNPKLQVIMEFNVVAMHRARSSPAHISSLLRQLGFRRALIIEQGRKDISLFEPLPHSGLIYNLLVTK